MQPTLVILAAGMGSRYGGLKQLDPVGPSGETIMDYAVYDAIRAGFGRLVFVIRESFEAEFRSRTQARYGDRIAMAYAHQRLDDLPDRFRLPDNREQPWGTAHAVYCARHAVDTPFAVINADDFYGADSFRILAARIRAADFTTPVAPLRLCMCGFTLRKTLSEHGTVSRGICAVGPGGHLTGVEECTDIAAGADGTITGRDSRDRIRNFTGDETVSMNMWGFPVTLFEAVGEQLADFLETVATLEPARAAKAEFYIPTVVNTLLRDGRATVDVLASPADWFGVTYREDRPRVTAAIRALVDAGRYPPSLWST